MIDFMKYLFYHLKSNYHFLRLKKALIKAKKLRDDEARFQKEVSKFVRHGQKFDMIQVKINALTNEIIAKYL